MKIDTINVEQYCSRCHKLMSDKDGSSTIGASITVTVDPPNDPTFMQKQMGKYGINRTYNFCWECWLDSLFGVRGN